MSILHTTGQLWKVLLGTVITVVGAIALAIAMKRTGDSQASASVTLLLMLGSATVAIAASVWTVVSVKCPKCRARWLWDSASRGTLAEGFFGTNVMRPSCPTCGYSGDPEGGS